MQRLPGETSNIDIFFNHSKFSIQAFTVQGIFQLNISAAQNSVDFFWISTALCSQKKKYVDKFIHYLSVHPEQEDIEGQAFHNEVTAIINWH